MKIQIILILLLLVSCGKKPDTINNTYVQKTEEHEQELEPTCTPHFVKSFYKLEYNMHYLKHSFNRMIEFEYADLTEVKEDYTKSRKKLLKFGTFKLEGDSCTLLENNKLRIIFANDYLAECNKFQNLVITEIRKRDSNFMKSDLTKYLRNPEHKDQD